MSSNSIAGPIVTPVPWRLGKGRRYRLVTEYYFEDVLSVWHMIPQGYMTDGASIPTLTGLTWAAMYSKYDPIVMRSALCHDYLCSARPLGTTSAQACELFQRMLMEDGAGRIRAQMMARAVSMFGPQWGGDSQEGDNSDEAGE